MIRWEECCDVLVIGAGAGGMAAALRAHDLGLDTLLIEKSEQYGGSSAVSGGAIWIPDSHRTLGARDTAAEVVAEAYVEHGHAMLEYLERDTRVRFEAQAQFPDDSAQLSGGKPGYRLMDPQPFNAAALGEDFLRMREPSPGTLLMGRMAMTVKEARVLLCRSRGWPGLAAKVLWRYWRDRGGRKLSRRDRFLTQGSALVGALRCSLLDRAVPLWLNCQLAQLLIVDDRIGGARVRRDGQWLNIKTRHGVIIAAGGFEGNQAMRLQPHQDGQPILGLYAIGNSAASMLRCTCPGGDATVGSAMTFGFLAANHIRENSQQRRGSRAVARNGR
ncbi:FAD-dependent oxidoreductase [Pseudomonas putida]|uniref:FAD-dependent oxidoreductase n=1 Tax=Pseudomonas putida TaxID=303 RepID=UPI00300F55C9